LVLKDAVIKGEVKLEGLRCKEKIS